MKVNKIHPTMWMNLRNTMVMTETRYKRVFTTGTHLFKAENQVKLFPVLGSQEGGRRDMTRREPQRG
jgi:hypothetical protein